MLIPLAMGLPGLIGGIISAVDAGKRLNQGRGVRRLAVRRHAKARGKGVAADIASALPLIGPIAGPLVRALGGKARRGKGLVPLHIYQPIAHGAGLRRHKKRVHHNRGKGLVPLHIYQPIAHGAGLRRHRRRHNKKGGMVAHKLRYRKRGGLLGPGMYRPAIYGSADGMFPIALTALAKSLPTTVPVSVPAVFPSKPPGHYLKSLTGSGIGRRVFTAPIGGLLSPSGVGGAYHHRRSHYRQVGNKRVHVKAAAVKRGGRMRSRGIRIVRY